MDDKNLMQTIWQRIEALPIWSGAAANYRAKDDLDGWLLRYKKMLAPTPPNLLSVLAADLRSLLRVQNHTKSPAVTQLVRAWPRLGAPNAP